MRLAVALGGIVGGLAHAQTAPDGQAGAVPGRARVVVVGNSEVAMVGQNGYCVINLYLHVPGRNPVHLNLTDEERRSCLLPWNHQDTTPRPEKSP